MNPDRRQTGGASRPSSVVTVNIFGVDYAVRGGADPEYIKEVAAHVDQVMRDIASRTKNVSATKIAVLAALQMTDQLYSERREKKRDQRQIAERTDSLLSRLDQTLLEVVE